jgi:cytochrome c oxidase subunit II
MTNLQPADNLPKSPPSPDFWMPRSASVTSAHVDWIWDFMIWMSVVSAILILGAMIYFCFKYQAKSRAANEFAERSTDHNTTLEVVWSVIPLFVVIALFVWGFQGFVELRTPPANAFEIRATGQKWKWLFEYPEGIVDDTLHVPVDRPVRIVISSQDVLHSLFIPNFRVKMDAVPGRYTDLWFKATEAGDFPIFCTEYCGTAHSDMLSRVIVHEAGGYEKWIEKASLPDPTKTPAERGKILADKQGCTTCHSADGSAKVGPTWKGLWRKSESTSAGPVTVDENYIRESITDPQAKVVNGFTPSMPTYQGKLKDHQLGDLIEYIKTLK